MKPTDAQRYDDLLLKIHNEHTQGTSKSLETVGTDKVSASSFNPQDCNADYNTDNPQLKCQNKIQLLIFSREGYKSDEWTM